MNCKRGDKLIITEDDGWLFAGDIVEFDDFTDIIDEIRVKKIDAYSLNYYTVSVSHVRFADDPTEPRKEAKKEPLPSDKCTCSVFQVINFGCKCGAFEREMASKKK